MVSPFNNCTDFFNWTSTYRDDSDLRLPYGWIEPIDRPFPYVPNWEETAMHWKTHPFNKTEFVRTLPQRPKTFLNLADRPGRVAWVVSNCQTSSKRERYVHELGKYIPVSQFDFCQIICQYLFLWRSWLSSLLLFVTGWYQDGNTISRTITEVTHLELNQFSDG